MIWSEDFLGKELTALGLRPLLQQPDSENTNQTSKNKECVDHSDLNRDETGRCPQANCY